MILLVKDLETLSSEEVKKGGQDLIKIVTANRVIITAVSLLQVAYSTDTFRKRVRDEVSLEE